MPATFVFQQVDVFAERPLQGNALAVVCDADDLSDEQMAALARWTNLSETTFLLRPTSPEADYRVRIFTPQRELPFAGHPTLGSCHVWLSNSGKPQGDVVVQECGAGLVRVRREGDQLAFAAPPLIRSGEVERATLQRISQALGLRAEQIVASNWVDNGPGWVGLLLASRSELLAVRPDYSQLAGLNVGVIAPWQGANAEADVEVRAFMGDAHDEDPVTGSLNASLAQWLLSTGQLPPCYLASQGTAIGRRGRVQISSLENDIWVGGQVQNCISGSVRL